LPSDVSCLKKWNDNDKINENAQAAPAGECEPPPPLTLKERMEQAMKAFLCTSFAVESTDVERARHANAVKNATLQL